MPTLTRTDIHRPSAINPQDYEFVAMEYIKIGAGGSIMGDCDYLQSERARIREHMARTGGNYAAHEHGGNCMVCGAGAIYTALFYHAGSNSYVRTGQECADKMGHGDLDWNRFRTALKDYTELWAGKRKAAGLLDERGLAAAWVIYTEPPAYRHPELEFRVVFLEEVDGIGGYECNCLVWRETGLPAREALTNPKWSTREGASRDWAADNYYRPMRDFERSVNYERTIVDIVGRLVKYGSISEAQYAHIGRLLGWIANRPARAEKRAVEAAAAKDCPSGRRVIEGVVLSVKVVPSEFSEVTKCLVKTDEGWKVWGTRPGIKDGGEYAESAEVGDRIRFKGTIQVSDKDTKFGFYSRPTNGEVVRRRDVVNVT